MLAESTTQRRYDDFGRKVVEINPDRGITLYRYDEASRMIARIDETRTTTRYTYDNANRLTALGADKEANLVQYHYQGQQLTEVISTADGKPEHAVERTQYQYNALGQITQERRWVARVDAQGAAMPQAASVPSIAQAGLTFTTSNTYDEVGHLTG
jgi:YD repeat-containing protein